MLSALSSDQQLLLQRKIHVNEGAYAASGRAVQAHFPSGWSAAVEAARRLGGLPEDALHWWAEQPHGHLLLTADDDSYAALALLDGEERRGVARLPMGWLLAEPMRALAAALRPLDHLLGCDGRTDGLWLSSGGGISPRWQQVGAQIAALFALGYGASEASRQDPRIYLAEGLALALRDPRRLNGQDPKLERLLGTSLLADGFWRNFRAESSKRQDADDAERND